MKWWPGCLGKVGTHCVLYAQLIIDGNEHGVKVFMVQLRDENHLPLKGVTLGDMGYKLGDSNNDTGFLMLNNVRIPREFMLSKYNAVTTDGKLIEVEKTDPQVHYTTMMSTRIMLSNLAGNRLCQAATIAIRYNAVRAQGFKSFESGIPYKSEEISLIDYKIQQYRLFKYLALGYALKLNGLWLLDKLKSIEGNEYGKINTTEGLKELAQTAAGIKSLFTMTCYYGIEELRKSCGGNGYLLNSGIGSMRAEYLWQITGEGDSYMLAINTGKFLFKSIDHALAGKKNQGVIEYFNVFMNENFKLKILQPQAANNSTDYYNLEYLLAWIKYRSLEKNFSVNREIHELILKKGINFTEASNYFANEMFIATNAHSFYLLFNNFITKLEEIKDESIKKVLTQLGILVGLNHFLDENWGDFLHQDQFRLIRTAVNNLINDIRPNAVALVDAFDYPDYVLKSTIGKYDGNVYEALYDAAQKSTLNKTEVFEGYDKVLRPHLDLGLLKKGNVPIPEKVEKILKF